MKNYFRAVWVALALTGALNTTGQVPILNSYPSATAVIYLDFDGHTFDNTSWNYNGPISCGASGLDETKITTVFNRVSEDYRPFNINVTTDEAKFLAAPINRRMRVVCTVSWEWYGQSGGVAFLGSFTWTDNSPCFVFTSLHGYSTKAIGEAAAHEVGHTLGLYHQSTYDINCNKIAEYNTGQGSGEIGWAPIMGNGLYQNLTLWNNGQSSQDCSDIQNDLAVITTVNGFSYRSDDHTDAFPTSTNATFSGNQFNVSGVIERNTDKDLFKFTQPAFGQFTLNAIPYNVGTGNSGSDLDLQVSLYNSSQTLLNVYNPGTLLSSVIDTVLNAGNYYLRVEGKGNIYAPFYASLGSYSLQGAYSSGNPLPLRRLELHGELNGDKHKLTWLIDADEQVTGQILEIATDGINFRPVTQSPVDARSFMYKPYVTTTAQYRLNVTFDNGRQYYSNIVTLRQTGNSPRPQLVSNLISNSQIDVTSPGSYSYTIHDFNGKTVLKGQLTMGTNTIQAAILSHGMYVIRFANATEQWIEKFVRQ